MNGNAAHLHNVFFKLTDSSSEATGKLIADCYTYLKSQDGVLFFAAGCRAEDCVREVNDQDYDVALTILFTSRATHDAYQISDLHNTFVDRNKDNWAGARVFDSDITA